MIDSVLEAERRLPALALIEDNQIRDETLRLAMDAPPYFWREPASQSEYHHPICRHEHGLWAHTLMVCTAVERLGDSYAELHGVDIDLARSAAILHDMRKHGNPDNPAESSTSDHDMYMADVIRGHSDLPEAVAQAVAEHMGPWYDGPEPSTPLAGLVHNADMMASTGNATLAVPGPVPDELQALGVREAQL